MKKTKPSLSARHSMNNNFRLWCLGFAVLATLGAIALLAVCLDHGVAAGFATANQSAALARVAYCVPVALPSGALSFCA